MLIRPLSSADIATRKPLPSSPSRLASGTLTSSRRRLAVAWPRRPSLPLISLASKPFASVGTRNAVTPRGPAPPVRAKTSATLAQVPLVMNTFSPVISQSSPSRVARAVRLPASEPMPGSVSPKQASVSPEAMLGSHSFFWSSVPYPAMDLPTRPRLTQTMPRIAESPRPSSSMSRQYDRESTGVPP